MPRGSIGLLACALAFSIETLIAARFMQAVGASGAIVLARGLDPTGSDQAQVLANQVSGFSDVAVLSFLLVGWLRQMPGARRVL